MGPMLRAARVATASERRIKLFFERMMDSCCSETIKLTLLWLIPRKTSSDPVAGAPDSSGSRFICEGLIAVFG